MSYEWEVVDEYAYTEIGPAEQPEPRIIGPLPEELPLAEWVVLMWPVVAVSALLLAKQEGVGV